MACDPGNETRQQPAINIELSASIDGTEPDGSRSGQQSSHNLLTPYSNSSADRWPQRLRSYDAALHNADISALELQNFEKKFLSKETAVRCFTFDSRGIDASESLLNADDVQGMLKTSATGTDHILFINRLLIHGNKDNLPKDQKRLRISKQALRTLLHGLECSPAMVSCLVNHDMPISPSFRLDLHLTGRTISDCWYTIPVRTGIPCTDRQFSHALSAAGSNQSDPSQYLHLGDCGLDIRPSQMVVYIHHDTSTHMTYVVVFDFQDGRWVDYADEPHRRAKQVLKQVQRYRGNYNPSFVHTLLHSSAISWWRSALEHFNEQLIAYERLLLGERYRGPTAQNTENVMEINSALHTMAAHLHRYKAEVQIMAENIEQLMKKLPCICTAAQCRMGNTSEASVARIQALDGLTPSIKGLMSFNAELEVKTNTIIALSFNTNQMLMDKQIVDSSESMRNILKATQEEAKHSRFIAKQSQDMAEEMRRDSISMKAATLLTMLFLPGTAFAAILSMPFFNQQPWLTKASRLWVWFLLTVPLTVLSVVFYVVFSRNAWKKRANQNSMALQDLDLGSAL